MRNIGKEKKENMKRKKSLDRGKNWMVVQPSLAIYFIVFLK